MLIIGKQVTCTIQVISDGYLVFIMLVGLELRDPFISGPLGEEEELDT
jgi:hypothetical protein